MHTLCVYIIRIIRILYTREIPAFGGTSLALRGNGAFGAAFRAPTAPILMNKYLDLINMFIMINPVYYFG